MLEGVDKVQFLRSCGAVRHGQKIQIRMPTSLFFRKISSSIPHQFCFMISTLSPAAVCLAHNVGIHAVEVYVPSRYVAQEDLDLQDNQPERLPGGLGPGAGRDHH